MWQIDGKIPLHAPGDKFLRYLCKHQLSLHLDISGLGVWVLLHYICEIFGHSFIMHFDSGSGPTDQKYCWVCGFTFRWSQPWLPFHLSPDVICEGLKACPQGAEQPFWRPWWGDTPGVSQSLMGGYTQCQNPPQHQRGGRGPPSSQWLPNTRLWQIHPSCTKPGRIEKGQLV